MTSFTTEDRISAEKEPVPFAGWMDTMYDQVLLLRDQVHAMNSEIIRLNAYAKELEAKVYGGTTK